jgi:hemerythrin-like domain-containing protein
LKIGQRPDHGFDEPLGLLSDCHRRIEHFLHILTTITDSVDGGVIGDVERAQLESALKYFATAGPRHTADEEESLFPRMDASHDRSAIDALGAIRRLESDHAEANTHHEAVDRLVRQWLAEGALAQSLVQELKEHLARLNTLYTAHIALEDREVFPAAARMLSPEDVHAIGCEMAARRGIDVRSPRGHVTTIPLHRPGER